MNGATFVMPTPGSSARGQAPVGIHDFPCCKRRSRGGRACARHDGGHDRWVSLYAGWYKARNHPQSSWPDLTWPSLAAPRLHRWAGSSTAMTTGTSRANRPGVDHSGARYYALASSQPARSSRSEPVPRQFCAPIPGCPHNARTSLGLAEGCVARAGLAPLSRPIRHLRRLSGIFTPRFDNARGMRLSD